VRALGTARTRELVLLGRRVDAAEAYRLGLLTELTPAGTALDRAVELATRLAAQPPLAVAWAKQAIDAAAESSTATGLLIEHLAYAALVAGAAPPPRGGTG
jgi:enoyl-CoA hydratase/carnithine racemase